MLSAYFKNGAIKLRAQMDYYYTVESISEGESGMRWMSGVVLATVTCLLGGCSSDYVMATRDGKMIMTDGKPEIDKETGLVKYTDQSGHELQINGDEVSTIIER